MQCTSAVCGLATLSLSEVTRMRAPHFAYCFQRVNKVFFVHVGNSLHCKSHTERPHVCSEYNKSRGLYLFMWLAFIFIRHFGKVLQHLGYTVNTWQASKSFVRSTIIFQDLILILTMTAIFYLSLLNQSPNFGILKKKLTLTCTQLFFYLYFCLI